MTKLKVVHLLDDFALGGVTRGLAIFNEGAAAAVAEHRVVALDPHAARAPRIEADIIVNHIPPSWRRLALLAGLRLRNPRARLIHVEHSYTRCWEALTVRHRVRFRAMLGIAARLVDGIVCVSAAQADWLAEAARFDRGRIRVIHPWSANPGLALLPPSAPEPGRPLRIAAYGRYAPAKGFDLLIQAFRRGAFGDATLRLAGLGPEEARLRALAEGCPQITVGGRVDDLAAFLAEADVVAVPSRWEAYGQVANEAREAGRPILVAATDGLVEQVGTAGLVIDFTDDNAIRAAMATLTPARCAAMGEAGRAAVAGAEDIRKGQWAALLRRFAPSSARAGAGRSKAPIAISAGQMR